MINFIICDDEHHITEIEKSIISKIMFKTNIEYKIHIFNNYDKSFFAMSNSNLSNKIYLLDIEVGDKSGLEVAKKIREKDWDSVILILTAHYELESIAYKSKILLLDFISKFDLFDKKITETILMCVDKIMNKDKLRIKSARKYEQIDFADILYITFDSITRKTKIITYDKIYETSEALKDLNKRLKGKFVITHRACIVNVNNVKTFDLKNRTIIFKNNTQIYLLSKRCIKDVKQYVMD